MTLLLQKKAFPMTKLNAIEQMFDTLELEKKPSISWLEGFQKSQIEGFAKQTFPNRKIEHWKYNDVHFLADKDYQRATAENITSASIESAKKIIEQQFDTSEQVIFTVINGHWIESLSFKTVKNAVTAIQFSQSNSQQQAYIQSQLKDSEQTRNSFIQLNNGLSRDGVLIEVSKQHDFKHPIVILQFNTQEDFCQISANQILVNGQPHSHFQLADYSFTLTADSTVLAHSASDNSVTNTAPVHLNLAQTQIDLEAASQCQYYRVQAEHSVAAKINRCVIKLAEKTLFNAFFYAQGGRIDKLDLDIIHQGEHSESHIAGIYLPRGQQNIDFHTTLEHRVGNCKSREVFRGIMADASSATFSGKIHILQDAQKTDAQLNNKNLLLTNRATINTKPELEIYADDVVCAHGATVAKIDPNAIYYLQTRGIDKTRAKKMLSIGFIQELIEQMPESRIRQDISTRAQLCLSDIQSI